MFILAGFAMARQMVDGHELRHANDGIAEKWHKQTTLDLLHNGEAKVQEMNPAYTIVQAVPASLCDEVAELAVHCGSSALW